jgi:hypothetical protein
LGQRIRAHVAEQFDRFGDVRINARSSDTKTTDALLGLVLPVGLIGLAWIIRAGDDHDVKRG